MLINKYGFSDDEAEETIYNWQSNMEEGDE
jgi:hypothetical protein